MSKRLLTVEVDEIVIHRLRRLAEKQGFRCKRGPGAPAGKGAIGAFLTALVEEASTKPLAGNGLWS